MKAILTIALALAAAGGGYAFFGNSGILPCCPADSDKAIAVTTVADTSKAGGCCDVDTNCADMVCDPVVCDAMGCDETEAGQYAMVQGGVLASPADAAACSAMKSECSAEAKAECSEAKAECSEAKMECSEAKAECSEAKIECTEAKMECTEKKSCDSKPTLD